MHKFHTVIFTYSKCLYFCSRHLAIYINYWKKRSLNLSFHLIIHHTTIVILLFYIWIIFLLLSSNFPTLEENPPTAREGKSVFVWQNTFCRTKTQLALFVWTENPPPADCCATWAEYCCPSEDVPSRLSVLTLQNYDRVNSCEIVDCMTYKDIWWHLMSWCRLHITCMPERPYFWRGLSVQYCNNIIGQ